MKKFIPFLILVGLIILVSFSTYKLNKKQEAGLKIDNNAKFEDSDFKFDKVKIKLPDFSFPNLFDNSDAASFSKEDLKGKYSLVVFFASWCTTCHAQHEVIMQLKEENIIDIYGVAWRDIEENSKKYLSKYGNPYKKVAKDSKGLFSRITGIEAVPENLIIDKNGVVIRRFQGNLDYAAIREIKKIITNHK